MGGREQGEAPLVPTNAASMGSGGSKYGNDIGVFGDLDVNKSGGFALAGSELAGTCYLRWDPRKLDLETFYRLQVTLLGEEKTTIQYERRERDFGDVDDHTTSQSVTYYARGSNVFLSQSIVLADVNRSTGKADLVFPYVFLLPNRLPTSMVDPFGGRDNCQVSYKVLVELVECGPGTGGGGWFQTNNNFRHEILFNVFTPPPSPQR